MVFDRGADVAYLDLLDPALRADSSVVRRAQAANWYARASIADYVVLRYGEVSALLREPRLRHGLYSWLSVNGITARPLVDWWDRLLLNREGADHGRLRRLVSKAFIPPAVEALRPFMRVTAQKLIDRLVERDSCQFIEEFADLYPSEIICELLGIPAGPREHFRGWARDIGRAFSIDVRAEEVRINAAVDALLHFVDGLLDERRRRPGDDLLSALLSVEDGGDRFSSDEIRMLVVSLIFLGNDTTRNQLGLGMYAFLHHPEQWALLAEQPQLASAAVEEVLRCYPTVSGLTRVAVEDLIFQGVPMPAGTSAYLYLAAANRDPAVFGAERGFNIAEPLPERILSFGGGIHHCLGSWLARAEMEEALPLLATHLRNPVLLAEPAWRTFGIGGFNELAIGYDPQMYATR